MSEQTIQEQRVHEYYKEIEAENFFLRTQLKKERKEVRRLKHVVRVWKGKAEGKENKQHYKKKEWY